MSASCPNPIGTGAVVRLTDEVLVSIVAGGAAGVGYRLNSNGLIDQTGTNAGTLGRWLYGGSNSQFEVRATLQSGVAPQAGDLNIWQALSIPRTWSNSQSSVGTRTSTLLIEIRGPGGFVVAQATVTITATSEL